MHSPLPPQIFYTSQNVIKLVYKATNHPCRWLVFLCYYHSQKHKFCQVILNMEKDRRISPTTFFLLKFFDDF